MASKVCAATRSAAPGTHSITSWSGVPSPLTSSNLYSNLAGWIAEAGRIKSSHKTAIAGWTGSVLRSALVYLVVCAAEGEQSVGANVQLVCTGVILAVEVEGLVPRLIATAESSTPPSTPSVSIKHR